MKRIHYFIETVLSLALLLAGCSSEEDKATTQSEVSFAFEMNGNLTKTDGSDKHEDAQSNCIDATELQQLAQQGKLYANIAIAELDTFEIKIHYIASSGSFATEAIPFQLGTYTIEGVTIANEVGDVLYAGVKVGSKYESQVQTSELMGNKKFTLTQEHLYRKTLLSVTVLCASHVEASDFGFIKWGLNPIIVSCVPFMVNVCTQEGDISGSGHLKVEYIDTDQQPLILTDFDFTSNGVLNEFCFTDRYLRPDAAEIHRFTLTLTGKQPQVKEISVAELKKFKQVKEWMNVLHFIHLNFCSGDTWFFDCETSKL